MAEGSPKKMKLFVVNQGSSVRVFHELVRRLEQDGRIESAVYYVADQRFYESFVAKNGPVAINGPVLKEWELVTAGVKRRPSFDEITAWERKMKVPSLWPALIADRRMMNGKNCKVVQDYPPQYSHEEMQGIAVTLTEALWKEFERQRPDAILSFSPSTIGGYLTYMVAEAWGIPSLNLKSLKIANYVSLSRDFHERHDHIRELYEQYMNSPEALEAVKGPAQAFLEKAQKGRLKYEGSLFDKEESLLLNLWTTLKQFPKMLVAELKAYQRRHLIDPQRQGPLATLWHSNLGRALRMRKLRRGVGKRFTRLESLPEKSFVFFPMNSEPEIALSVYSRYTLNQIEVVRNFAQSLPLGMVLAVKDHPRSWGLRPPGYYKKLLEIPNVRLLPVETPTDAAIARAKAVAVISSFVGFEGVLIGVPALALGDISYDMLPESMVRVVKCFDELPTTFQSLFENYKRDDRAILAFVAAVIQGGVPVDLYSRMLAKGSREAGTGSEQRDLSTQYDLFAKYLVQRFEAITRPR